MTDQHTPAKVIGVTGGIGSGKSLISELFHSLNYPIYNSDYEAKNLYKNPETREQVISLLGPDSFKGMELNRAYVGMKVFSDSKLLTELNHIIHPAVGAHFSDWKKAQSSPYLIKEAAILIESGAYKSCDYIITVSAPEQLRLERVMNRDGVKPADVQARMDKQLSDDDRNTYANWIITNDGSSSVIKQVIEIHKELNHM